MEKQGIKETSILLYACGQTISSITLFQEKILKQMLSLKANLLQLLDAGYDNMIITNKGNVTFLIHRLEHKAYEIQNCSQSLNL